MDRFGQDPFQDPIDDRDDPEGNGRPSEHRAPDLFESVGRLVGEIEALKLEREAEMARTARIRIGAVYAKARLEKRVSGH
ncbi:MAG TPA: hypothetical protein VGU24_16385 [Microvirga sp.]|jgi:hypothetical protein|nr:hypothetical protein [Microvirga sp.]